MVGISHPYLFSNGTADSYRIVQCPVLLGSGDVDSSKSDKCLQESMFNPFSLSLIVSSELFAKYWAHVYPGQPIVSFLLALLSHSFFQDCDL